MARGTQAVPDVAQVLLAGVAEVLQGKSVASGDLRLSPRPVYRVHHQVD